MEIILLYVISSPFVVGCFCAFVATQKNRSAWGWFFLGLFFNLIAMLALIAVPSLEKLKGE